MSYLTDEKHEEQYDKLYERFGRPLEEKHKGEYLAISPEGKVLLAPTLYEAMTQASKAFGKENYLYKIGERAVATAL